MWNREALKIENHKSRLFHKVGSKASKNSLLIYFNSHSDNLSSWSEELPDMQKHKRTFTLKLGPGHPKTICDIFSTQPHWKPSTWNGEPLPTLKSTKAKNSL